MDERIVNDVLEEARSVVPDLRRAPGPCSRSTKCVIVPATIGARSVVVKAVVHEPEVWGWYLGHERAVYDRLPASVGDKLRVPRLVAASDRLLVIDRMPGEPLARQRHDPKIRRIGDATWEALLSACGRLRELAPPAVEPPSRATVAVMRRRLLEDPSAPTAWIVEGIGRLRARSMLESADAARMIRALSEYPATRFSHGDLLLRNVLADGDASLSLVDWECAGEHVFAWDAALLWVFAPSWARRRLEMEYAAHAGTRPAFFACVAFALCREAFYRRRRASDAVADRLKRDLAEALSTMRGSPVYPPVGA